MAPLVILLSAFLVASLALRRASTRRRARLALGVMLAFTAMSHLFSTAALAAMLPLPVGLATALVYATGVIEAAFGVALLRPAPPRWLGILLAAFFVGLLPANIYSAIAGSGMGAHGIAYLWFRIPLQLLFILWAIASTRRP